ncbi:MAG: glutathione S-transferase N-terminal domain-containing protein [Azospirillaceae bacterium]
MIDLYTWTTPNGRKASIMLEETGLPYTVHPVNIGKDEQFDPAFLAISPNNKIPAIVDHDPGDPDGGQGPLAIFESGAILIHLAENTGSLLPASGRARADVLAWLMFQMGGIGPMFGQYGHFTIFAKEPVPYAVERYAAEARRLLGVMETRLGAVDYLGGDYSIADIATYPWIRGYYDRSVDLGWEELPRVGAWLERIAARPAVARGMAVPKV